MIDQEMTWDEWVEELATDSWGEVDYSGVDEESAKANHPQLYEYYENGYNVADLLSERLMSYEGGEFQVWIDPDDNEDILDLQLSAVLSNTEFYQTFSSEVTSLKTLNRIEVADSNALKLLKRQIHITAITCLETYLSDAFINTVLSDVKHLRSFFHSFKDFEEKKIKMSELLVKAECAEDIAKMAMINVIWHNLPKVKNIYETTLKISFPEFSKLQKCIEVRHDLVHRSGKTKDGQEIFIGEEAILELLCEIERFVNEIDQKLRNLLA